MFKAFWDWFGDFVCGVLDGFGLAEQHEFMRPAESHRINNAFPGAWCECLSNDSGESVSNENNGGAE